MKIEIMFTAIAMIFSAIFSLPLVSFAQVGSLDFNFGNNGIVNTDIGPSGSNDQGVTIAIQTDGKILMAGNSTIGVTTPTGSMIYIGRYALTRYNVNGSLDNSFGVNGKVTTFLGNYTLYVNYLNGMALQSDGKILVSGTGMNNSVSVLIRYNHNGTLDSTFDYDGIVTTVIGSHSLKQLICIQPDGKIVTAGRCVGASELIALARYNTNGSLDTTFNSNGIVTTSIGSINDGAESISLQPDGKILVGGYSFNGTNTNFAVLRYNTNGSLDTTFNADGIITTAIGTNSSVYSISLQSDGKIVAGGESQIGTGAIINFAIARYNTNGSLDSTFGTTGIIVTSIGNYNDYGRALTIQSNGKILLVGGTTLTNGSTYQSALVRYNINGILDSTFDNDGIVTTFFSTGNYSDGNAIILQSDGKIVVGGIAGYDFVLARYNNDIPIEVNEICKEVPKVRIYPNPFIISTNLNIETPLKNAKLSIYNNFGQLVKKIENLYGTDITINRDNLLNGLYYFQLTEENEVISKNKFVIAD